MFPSCHKSGKDLPCSHTSTSSEISEHKWLPVSPSLLQTAVSPQKLLFVTFFYSRGSNTIFFFDGDKLRVLDIASIMQSYHSSSIRNILFSFMPGCVQAKSSQECVTAANLVGQQAGRTCVTHLPSTAAQPISILHSICGLQNSQKNHNTQK